MSGADAAEAGATSFPSRTHKIAAGSTVLQPQTAIQPDTAIFAPL